MNTTYWNGQKLDDDQRKLIETAYSRLEAWRDDNQEFHERARVARKVMLLQDPYQDAPGTEPQKKALQLQSLKSTLNNCMADQMDNMPEAMMIPETPGLQDVADDLTDVVRYVMGANGYDGLHYARVSDYFVTGTAITQVAWDADMDYGEGNIAVVRWPVEAFVWDPYAQNIQDARALFKVSWHPLSWFEAHYPDVAMFISGEDGQYSSLGVPDSQETRQGDDEERAMLLEYWYREYDAKKRRYAINVAYLAGGALLYEQKNVYAHGMYPFVVDVFTPIEGVPAGEGLVMELAPMMRYVNRYAQYIDENLRMSAKNRLLVRQSAQVDMEALSDWSRDIIQGQNVDEQSVRWMQSKPFTGLATQQMLQFQTDIKQDSGQNQFTRGETAGGVNAASAIALLQEAGGKITRMHTDRLNFGFKQIAEQVVWLVSQFYTDKRVRMITGKDGKPRAVDMSSMHLMGGDVLPPEVQEQLDALPGEVQAEILEKARKKHRGKRGKGGALPPPPYTVQVEVNRKNPVRAQAQNELFMQAYSMSAQSGQVFPLSLLFEILSVDGKDRILPMLRQSEQLTQTLNQLAQENQMLKQQAQGLQAVVAEYGNALASGGEDALGGAPPLQGENGVPVPEENDAQGMATAPAV